MINLALAIAAAAVLTTLLALLRVNLWIAMPLGITTGIALYIYLGRQIQKQLEQIFTRAGELLKKQKFDPAIAVMKEGYALAPRQFMVKGSIDGQIGVIQFLRQKHDEAEPLLKAASMNHYIAKVMLGILQWKRGEKKACRTTLELALKAGKKESVLYGVYAWILTEMKDRDKAIQVLGTGLKYCKGDERLQSNLTLLQNNKPLKMKVFGEQWYQFMLERPMIRQEPPPYARVSKRALRG